MTLRRRRLLASLSLAAVAAGVAAVLLLSPGESLLDATRKRIAALKPAVEGQPAASERAVADYLPAVHGRLDDFAVPADALLRQLPGVVEVETLVIAPKPKHRLFHLRDWHQVPRRLFDEEAQRVHGRELAADEGQALYDEHLLHVELVQLEHTTVLRCLAKHHGVKRVLVEGMVENESLLYGLRALELYRAASPGRERRADVLRLGAPAPLIAARELDDVLPLDDAKLLVRTYPLLGRPVDIAALRAREDFQVRAALASGPASVVVLGGSHDLTDSIRRVGGGAVEYLRVTTRRYRDADGG